MATAETGKCDPLSAGCWENYINCTASQCTFGNCSIDTGASTEQMRIPADVPIKTTIKGLMPAPFVKIRFESIWLPDAKEPGGTPATEADWDFTEITTGNISQPYNNEQCKTAIKSFQFSWGTVSAGYTCKVTLVDEVGSDLENWFSRILKNPAVDPIVQPQGTFKMKVFFGWIVAGSDEECPTATTGNIGNIEVTGGGIYNLYNDIQSIPINNSTTPAKFISSPPLWFMPVSLSANYQGNRITFEIEGKDALQVAAQFPAPFTYGTDYAKVYFKEAVECLAADSQPPFRVRFKQINDTTGAVEELQFHVNSGAGSATAVDCTPNTTQIEFSSGLFPVPIAIRHCPRCIDLTERQSVDASGGNRLEELGPLGTWARHNLSPMQTIQQWLRSGNVRAKTTQQGTQGKGITMNFDPINRVCTLWADGLPGCGRNVELYTTTTSRIKAAYLVSGGKCSPVYSFTPVIKWAFLASAQRGGIAAPNTSRPLNTSNADQQQELSPGVPICSLPGVGNRASPVAGQNTLNTAGSDAAAQTQLTNVLHRRANQLFAPLEAELRVQGDPSDWLCSPLFGYGRFIALIVNNPFYLDEDTDFGCPLWKQGDQTTHGSCHNVLTSPAWIIKGADHQIRDGSFVTTIKIALQAPGSNLSTANYLGSGSGSQQQTVGGVTQNGTMWAGDGPSSGPLNNCNQGTFPCIDNVDQKMQLGALAYGYGNPLFASFGKGSTLPFVDSGAGTSIFCDGLCLSSSGVT